MVNSIDFPLELLIIDNGDALIHLDTPEQVSLRIIRMPSNQGVAGSWNLGIKLYPFEKVWFFSSADTQYKPGALQELSQAAEDAITLTHQFPYWNTFAIGQEVVKKIGLFDESIYPIYFEDTEYTWRANAAGIKIEHKTIETHHDNSSTINSDLKLMAQNSKTFRSNEMYFASKQNNNDYSEGRWDLIRRRENNWQR
jgi:GT2 family glycosyltransferase